MRNEIKFILMHYIESICLLSSSFFALVGFYFGLLTIIKTEEPVKGIFQCIITIISFVVLFVLFIKTLRNIKKQRRNIKK
jgi:uncharacterized membrane protein